jgi:hypothetical protein
MWLSAGERLELELLAERLGLADEAAGEDVGALAQGRHAAEVRRYGHEAGGSAGSIGYFTAVHVTPQ